MSAEQANYNAGKGRYSSFRFRMAIGMVIVSLAPMFLVSFIILYQFQIYSNETVHAHLGELVLKHRQNIDFFLRQKLNDLSHLSKSFSIAQLKDEKFLKQRLRVLQDEYSFVFVDLGVIDKSGRQVAYAGPFELLMADYSDAEWFKKAIRSDTYISDVFLGLRGQPHFIVAVKAPWDGVEWILRATIDFVAFNTLVENLSVGKTGMAFILNRNGEYQTRPPQHKPELSRAQYLNLFQKGDRALLSIHKPEADFELQHTLTYQKKYMNGTVHEGDQKSSIFSVEKEGKNGNKFIIVAAYLKNYEWLLIFQQEVEDAFAKLRATQMMAGLISLGGALIIIAMAFIVSGRISRHIAKSDFEKEVMNQQIIETGKLASVGELAAGIAHEINNPVAIMVEEAGWVQDLLSEGIDKENNLEEFNRALKQIENQGRRCKEITHKLLSFARKTDSRVQSVQLNELIPEVVDLLSQKSRYANVEVGVDLQPDLPAIQASVTEMQQVLMNILHNAVDAMETNGGKISIATRTGAGDILISIADTGPGIPASNLGRLFDPFFTTKPVGKGTGLGLSICYGIIHKMGGRIEVESQVGRGTTFKIVLPFDQQAAAS